MRFIICSIRAWADGRMLFPWGLVGWAIATCFSSFTKKMSWLEHTKNICRFWRASQSTFGLATLSFTKVIPVMNCYPVSSHHCRAHVDTALIQSVAIFHMLICQFASYTSFPGFLQRQIDDSTNIHLLESSPKSNEDHFHEQPVRFCFFLQKGSMKVKRLCVCTVIIWCYESKLKIYYTPSNACLWQTGLNIFDMFDPVILISPQMGPHRPSLEGNFKLQTQLAAQVRSKYSK